MFQGEGIDTTQGDKSPGLDFRSRLSEGLFTYRVQSSPAAMGICLGAHRPAERRISLNGGYK